jgi:septal ring-binding cell division protein DamX
MPSEQPVGGSSDARPEQGGGTALSSLKRWFGLSSDEKDVVATDKGGLPAIKANDYGNLDIPPEEATARGRQSPAVVGRGCAIQLAASSQRHGLDQLVSRYGLGNKAWVITETRAGRPWYSLMYGRYEDASDALAEMKALPEGLSTAPWVRTLKGQ